MRVDHRGPHVTVTEQRLDRTDVVVRLQEVGREGMAERMCRHPFQELGTTDRCMDIPLHMRLMEMISPLLVRRWDKRQFVCRKEPLPDQLLSCSRVFLLRWLSMNTPA